MQWIQQEDDLLKAKFATTGTYDLLPLFPGRTWKSLVHRATKLGLSKTKECRTNLTRKASSLSQNDILLMKDKYSKIEQYKWQYLAGMIDSDGCIRLYKNTANYSPVIYVTNISESLIDWLVNNFGGSKNNIRHKTGDSINGITVKSRRQAFSWKLTGLENVVELLKYLKSELIIKRQQAEIILDAHSQGWYSINLEPVYTKLIQSKKEYDINNSCSSVITDAYLAGMIDGDGCIILRYNNYDFINAMLDISNESIILNKKLLDLGWNQFMNRGLIHNTIYKQKDCLSLLLNISPYLIIKKEQAELVIEFLQNKKTLDKEGQEDYKNRLSLLKQG
jgi:hypothetical protein